jgi:hypothetical protein
MTPSSQDSQSPTRTTGEAERSHKKVRDMDTQDCPFDMAPPTNTTKSSRKSQKQLPAPLARQPTPISARFPQASHVGSSLHSPVTSLEHAATTDQSLTPAGSYWTPINQRALEYVLPQAPAPLATPQTATSIHNPIYNPFLAPSTITPRIPSDAQAVNQGATTGATHSAAHHKDPRQFHIIGRASVKRDRTGNMVSQTMPVSALLEHYFGLSLES